MNEQLLKLLVAPLEHDGLESSVVILYLLLLNGEHHTNLTQQIC